jgi:hypothetical protein
MRGILQTLFHRRNTAWGRAHTLVRAPTYAADPATRFAPHCSDASQLRIGDIAGDVLRPQVLEQRGA